MVDECRRDKGAVRCVAFFDMILSFLLFIFYIGIAVFTNSLIFSVPNGPFSKISLVVISLIMWGVVFVMTYLQISMAYGVFLVTFQDVLGPRVAADRCMAWLRFSVAIFCFIGFKMIYCYLRFQSATALFWVLSITEIVFRLLGIYFIREFCDDLKHHIRITTIAPKTSVKNSNVPQVLVSNHIDDV